MMAALDFKKTVSQLMGRTKSASDELRIGVESIRKRTADLRDQKYRVEQMPPTLAVAISRMEEWVDQEIRAAKANLPTAFEFTAAVPADNVGMYSKPEKIGFGFLGAQIKAAYAHEIGNLYEQNPGISEDERADRLDRIDQELLDAELTEESIIRAAESSGFILSRRANADPRAVLAPDKAMP